MKTISIEEYIEMPIEDLGRLMSSSTSFTDAGHECSGVKVDMHGLLISDLVEKYDLLTIDQVRDRIMTKLHG